MGREAEHSLADFYFSDSDDPLRPPEGFVQWAEAGSWAMSMYEPHMLGAVAPRMAIERAGERSDVINLSSYNYLGLATHPEVVEAAQEALRTYGTGACGSPLLSGLSDLHRGLERELAAFLGQEDCILFNSGFAGEWARWPACCARATWPSSTPRPTCARSTASSCRAPSWCSSTTTTPTRSTRR
ncbi:aminotransferase class I/II-fold pyridoxal phosphate-dependent enzyme [Nannocystis pusilla]|uniref:aminotransferase class I/II-fold pyridoxal phosphate-dependent enzyme n=1 Tax=Nannocystis pusilla TaxID=889268 RepID=UPI003B7C9FEB